MPEIAPQERGRYIVIEGPEGAGKTTQVERLAGQLALMGYETRDDIREPGGTLIGEAIREVLKNPDLPRSGETNLYLFSAARLEVLKLIKQETEDGKWVLCDRNQLSTLAYQVFGEGVDRDLYIKLTQPLAEIIEPDLTLILMISNEEQYRRLTERGGSDYFEQLNEQFHTKVKRGYLQIAKSILYQMVDGELTEEAIESIIWQYVEPMTEGENPPLAEMQEQSEKTQIKYIHKLQEETA